jgi:rhamnosyltransferase
MTDELSARPGARASVCAVIVTYHPAGTFPLHLQRIIPQVGATLVVDNGSFAYELDNIRPEKTLSVVRNGANLGLARALNIGVERARAAGFDWALLLDQDTRVDADMVDCLLAALASCSDGARVAAVGSRFRDSHGLAIESLQRGAQGALWKEVESVITSGSLLSLAAYGVIGPFRDEFFIDHVDTEYCFRARAAGYRVIETVRPLMSHTFGTPTAHRLFGRTTWTTNHSADRRYYMARNNTVMLKEYGTAGRSPWQWKSFVRSLRLAKRIAYFEGDKFAKISAVAQGWWHGLRGRLGPR